ncbi:DUF1634 domain-containing protein [Hassallia byssoidea VB512170]|uniref:DUF1634 domain-containing protein n=1 Tax=Hassallia byssoidea VB512170 TaxID=1304833 RepID=A0A846HH54_9CYAN|nr:DUF1634 domain-containing protein [Hassalia byssoidea]NEU75741.1 DUF1634 domain-containing protein [Hassalia byssoidea VB512170]
MYKFNSSGWEWKSSVQSKVELVALPLQSEPDSDIQELTERAHKITDDIDSNSITKTSSEQQLENLLSNLLKYGVFIASAVVLLGGILYLIRHGAEPAEYQFFRGTPSQFRSPTGVVEAVFSGSSRGIIQLGLLLLIATPIVRVIVSLLAFIRRRDLIYIFVNLFVLAALTYSLIGAYY